ncbi:hypothetical protein [Carboxylicivirga marina]|uniref:hypothetical protein n=1 Tax=Carboxylicivirga marina TaxID=2800988 RepID=UPI0025954958|nr:hypothetical protein [uncultured Carboxylicivirga sp.]
MIKLVILHYLPIEYYPPVTNLIDYLASERVGDIKQVKVYSTHNVKGREEYQVSRYKYQDLKKIVDKEIDRSSLIIKRSPFPKESDNSLTRLLKYLHYNLLTLIGLIIYRPNDLLYYESYSAWPVYIYTKYFNRKCRLFIHFHEYASKDWYATTMKQVQYFHRLEKKWLYPRAQWISQTNNDRLQFFHNDHPYIKEEQLRVMPNYPSKDWLKVKGEGYKEKGTKLTPTPSTLNLKPVKLVYVGSLSFQSTYLRELCEWVLNQNGQVLFDIYAYNLYEDVKSYLKGLNSAWVNYYEQGVEYNEQPKLLAQYDVGLILYKAHNQNYTYNAPNKLFEYLACDLDVWYPNVLQGPKPYDTTTTYPKVIPVDFEHLDVFDWRKAINNDGCKYKASDYFCEEVYKELVDEIVGKKLIGKRN